MRPATCFYWAARNCFATDAGGRRTILVKGDKTKANRELALQRLAELLADRPSGQTATPANVTVRELVDMFLSDCAMRVAANDLKPLTFGSYRAYGRLLKQECGSWSADRVDESQVLEYRRELCKRPLSPTTIKNRLVTLRVVLRWAQRNKLIARIPRIPTGKARRREHIPTAEELNRLLDAVRPDVRDVLTVVMNVAVRPGDCFALRRGWVDLDAGLFRLPDSKRGQRLVPIGQIPVVTEILTRRLASVTGPDDFVFTTVTGRPWNFRYFGELVRKARHCAGLGDHVVTYSLRHFFTTQALLNNVPLETVAALRGDANIGTTMIYSHLARHISVLQAAATQAVGLTPSYGDEE